MSKARKEIEIALEKYGAIAIEWGFKRKHGTVRVKLKSGLIVNLIFPLSRKYDGNIRLNTETHLKKLNREEERKGHGAA